jgi:hypothetical protein
MEEMQYGYNNSTHELAKEFLRGAARVVTLTGNMSNKEAVDLLNHHLAKESVFLYESSDKAAIALGVTPKTIREHSKKPQIKTNEDLVEMGYKIFNIAPEFGLTEEEFEWNLAEECRKKGKEISIEQDVAGDILDILARLGKVRRTTTKRYVPIETDKYEQLTKLHDILKNIVRGLEFFTEATCLKIEQIGINREKESQALHANIGAEIRWSDIQEFKERLTKDAHKLAEIFEQRARKDLLNSVKYAIQISGFPKDERPRSERDLKGKILKGAAKKNKREK